MPKLVAVLEELFETEIDSVESVECNFPICSRCISKLNKIQSIDLELSTIMERLREERTVLINMMKKKLPSNHKLKKKQLDEAQQQDVPNAKAVTTPGNIPTGSRKRLIVHTPPKLAMKAIRADMCDKDFPAESQLISQCHLPQLELIPIQTEEDTEMAAEADLPETVKVLIT